MPRFRRKTLSTLLLSTLALTTLLTGILPQVRGAFNFSNPSQVPIGASLSPDPKLQFLDAAPVSGTMLSSDPHIKYIDASMNGVWDPGEAVVYDTNNKNISLATDPVIAGTPTQLAMLVVDPKLKFVDVNNNGVWHPGEPVVYDSNGNSHYDSGEPVVAGSPPRLQASLSPDSRVKFVDTNNNGVWSLGETVVYDTFGKGYYNASIDSHIKFVDSNNAGVWSPGKTVIYDTNSTGVYASGDPILNGTAPAVGTILKLDSRIRFVDTNRSGFWAQGEAIVYDSNNNGLYESTEPVIVQGNPVPQTVLSSDSRIKYWDSNNTNSWNPGKTVVYDTFGNGHYNNNTDPHIKYYDKNNNSIWDPSIDSVVYNKKNDGIYLCTDPVIAGPQPPCFSSLANDKHFRFVDSFRTGRWASGDTVIFDANLDNIYDAGDVIVAGTAPPIGTPLREPIIYGSVPPIGAPLKTDSKIRFVDLTSGGFWAQGEAVVYDTNSNSLYEAGELVIVGGNPAAGTLLSEPVIAGPVPTYGTQLKPDSKILFIDANNNLTWDLGEMVVNDSNNDNGHYTLGDRVIANGASGDGVWHQGEPVLYDSNGNGSYDPGDTVVYGSSPPNGTALRVDSRIKFIDTDGNNVWDSGETVVYDSNNDGVYESGKPIIVGVAPQAFLPLHPSLASDPIGRIWLAWDQAPVGTSLNPDIYFKTSNTTAWSSQQQVTGNAGVNNAPALTPLFNNTMMITWSSNRTGHPLLFYRLYADGVPNPYATTGPIQLTSNATYDTSPSAVQDRNGRIWVTWARQNGAGAPSSLYYKYFNGTSWSTDSAIPTASVPTLTQSTPSIIQAKDGQIWVVFASDDIGADSVYYTTTSGTISPLPSTPSNSWTAKLPLYTGNIANEDGHPSILQARDGLLWVFFQRSTVTGDQILYTNSTSNGSSGSWSLPWGSFGIAPDQSPAAGQMPDNRIWVFWIRQGASNEQVMSSSSDKINNIHDVGLQNISFASRIVESGDTLNVSVTAINYGNYSETPTLTFAMNNTVIDTVNLSLSKGQVQVLQFTWQTVQPNWGRYKLAATLTPIPGENVINQGDDSIAISWVRVSPPGDVNRDGVVNISDLAIIAFGYHSSPGSPNWNPLADVNKDGHIDISDLSTCAFWYHRSVP